MDLANPKDYKIILGSKSPRRKALLAEIISTFETRSKEVDESFPANMDIRKVAEFLACKKGAAFHKELKENELLLCSDTTVCVGDEILNKPANSEEARAMLEKLSGKKHEVITGVCLKSKDKEISFSDCTEVYFKNLSPAEIDYYIEKHQPFDKAGSYGIQEWIGFIGVEKIVGDYYNVMGLPLRKVYEGIKTF